MALETEILNRDEVETLLHNAAKPTTWTHADIMAQEFDTLTWVIEGLVPFDGLSVLGGKKKLGKSWLCVQFAAAVASGTPTLGRTTHQGAVVYVCLEDGPRRLQSRLRAQGVARNLPITYVTTMPPLDAHGMFELTRLVREANPVLLIIDTLAAAKAGWSENSVTGMTELANRLKDLARDNNLGCILVAHHGKEIKGDPGDDLRGSSALAAAADVNLGLYKTESNFVIKAEGRDIEEQDIRVVLEIGTNWAWRLVGDSRTLAQSEVEEEIFEALTLLVEADAGALARECGKTRQAVQVTLQRMRESGRIAYRREPGTTKIVYRRLEEGESAPQDSVEDEDGRSDDPEVT